MSRRIFGDPAAGAIANAQVYQVTGEGARDVIVGVPAAEAGAGRLYFTISPRLQVSRTTETLVTNKGNSATSSTAIAVTNPSVVITGWQATSSAPWLRPGRRPARRAVVPRRVLCRRTDEHPLGRHLYRHAERDRHEP